MQLNSNERIEEGSNESLDISGIRIEHPRGRLRNLQAGRANEERSVADLLNEGRDINPSSIGGSEESESEKTLNVTLFDTQEDIELPSIEAENKNLMKIPDFSRNAIYFAAHDSRAISAPARPRTDLEKFRASHSFAFLENAAICASQIIVRNDYKYDLDSNEGQRNCKKLLEQIECLCNCLRAACCSREYRNRFSQAYQILFTENSLCYLTEILDSAQESKIIYFNNCQNSHICG